MKKLDILLLHFESAEVSHYKLQVGLGPSVLYLDNTISISALKFGNVQPINEAV